MKKNNLKRNLSGYNNDYDSVFGKSTPTPRSKTSKKRISIYEDFEDDEEETELYEKFKKRHKS